MKYIIFFVGCLLVLVSCTKEGEYFAPEETVYTAKKNAFRATKITGTNSHWGDFNLYLEYDKEELSSIVRTNTLGDTTGGFGLLRGTNYLSLSIRDYIPSIDKDSIQRLDEQFKELYGVGNYSLKDSIPLSSQTIRGVTVYVYTDGRVKKSIIRQYVPNPKAELTGKEFKYSYILTKSTASTYEYNTNSDIVVNRVMYDVHDSTDSDIYDRSLYKTEALFQKDRLMSLGCFTAKEGENFAEYNRYNYTYEGDRLIRIQGEGFTRTFVYNGNQVTKTTNDTETVTYELDSHGNVVKMDDGKGNVYQIEYEPGHGNLSLFTSQTDKILNPFYIK